MRPKNNGAWIIRNSWGERNEGTIKEAKENVFNRYKDYCVSQGANSASQVTEKILKHFEYVIENGRAYQKIGDNGYMYVSYEDDVISKDMTGVIKVENEVSYNNMYNYDKYLAANNLTGSFEELFLLNVFDKKNTGKEYLTSVSIYAPTKYTASVYVNPDNEDKNMEKMQLMLLKNGIEETFEAGYHTIVFKNPIELTGNKFAVCIKVKNSNNEIGVALESKIDGYKMLDNVKVENNRCFVGLKNKSNEILWNDLSNGKNLGNINPGDLTIKAYTTNNLEDGSLNKIEIMTPPNKTNYIEGENFDKTGMKIKAYYNTIDHKEVILKDSDYSIMDANNLTYGQENITIQYMDKLLFQPITVDKNSVVKLSIKNPPIKTEYIEGEKFDKTGIIVEAEYKNGAKKEINNYTISNENKLTKDITSVVISYENVTVEQKIVVKERKIEKIEIKKLPNKKMYLQNKEELDLTGGILLIRYNNDTTAEIDLNSSEVKATGFDNTKLGENTINIEYKMLKTNFNVKIVDKHVNPNLLVKIKIKKNPNKIDYFENEKFDDTGMEIVGVYEDLHEELIDSYQIVNGNNLKFNQEKVIIQYKDFYVEVKINVKNIELVKVSLKNKPNKLIYVQDEEQLDLSGGKLLLEYNNGIEKEIDLYNENVEITGFNNKELGNQLIKINYQNHELNFNVEII